MLVRVESLHAGYGLAGPFEATTTDQIRRQFDVNVFGLMNVCREIIPYFREQKRGTIVNVASVAGVMGEAYSAAYTSAKHGIVGLTRALAVEYLKEPLRVNCVCPGGMDTPQVQTIGVPDGADWDLIMRVAATRGLMSADDSRELREVRGQRR